MHAQLNCMQCVLWPSTLFLHDTLPTTDHVTLRLTVQTFLIESLQETLGKTLAECMALKAEQALWTGNDATLVRPLHFLSSISFLLSIRSTLRLSW